MWRVGDKITAQKLREKIKENKIKNETGPATEPTTV